MTEEFFTEGEFARRQKKLEPDKVLTEVAPTGINEAKQVNRQGSQRLVARSAGAARAGRVANSKACQSNSLPAKAVLPL